MFTKFRRSEDGSLTLEAAMVLPNSSMFDSFIVVDLTVKNIGEATIDAYDPVNMREHYGMDKPIIRFWWTTN